MLPALLLENNINAIPCHTNHFSGEANGMCLSLNSLQNKDIKEKGTIKTLIAIKLRRVGEIQEIQ